MALLKFWVASEVWQHPDGSWGSPLDEDFGIEYGPITQDGTIYINRPHRRDGEIGWLRGDVPFYTRGVITDGVQQWSDILAVSYPIVPAVAIVECVADSDVLLQIHMGVGSTTGSHYRVLAATLHPDEDPGLAPGLLAQSSPAAGRPARHRLTIIAMTATVKSTFSIAWNIAATSFPVTSIVTSGF